MINFQGYGRTIILKDKMVSVNSDIGYFLKQKEIGLETKYFYAEYKI